MSLLPGLTYSAPGVPLYGSGGGGGSNTPNPQLSSIVINGLTTAITGQGGIAFAFDFPDNSANIPAGSFVGLQQGVVSGTGFGNTNAVLAAVNAGGLAATADFAAQRVIVGQQGTGASASAKPYLTEANGLMSIIPGISTLALNVSSINGGIPAVTSLFSTLFAANPSLSTIVY